MKQLRYILSAFLACCISLISFSQTPLLDSLLQIINTTKNDSTKAMATLRLAFYYNFNDVAAAKKYIDMGVQLSKEKKLPYCEVYSYNVLGIYYDVQGIGDSAYASFKNGIQINKQYHFTDLEVKLLNNLGMYCWNNGQLIEAQSYFFESLEKNNLVKDAQKKTDESIMFSNIGLIYQEQDLYAKALTYHYKALSIRRKNKQVEQIPLSLNNIGICYVHLDSIDKSIQILQDGIGLATEQNNLRALVDLKSSLSSSYTTKGNYAAALKLQLEILAMQQEIILAPKLVMNQEALVAGSYMMLHDYPSAWKHMNSALELLKAHPELHYFASSVYSFASSLYFISQNPEKGLEYNLLGQKLLEEKSNELHQRKLSELEVRYETQKKEITIAQQRTSIALAQQAITQRNYWILLIVVLALGALIILYLIQNKRKQQAEKAEEQRITNAIFESEQKERVRIARDLHDTVGQKLSVIKMLLSQQPQDTTMQKVTQYLDETVAEIRTISHNMIPEILNFGLINALEDITDRLNSTEAMEVTFLYDTTLQKLPLTIQTEVTIYRVVQEIVANIIKHARSTKMLLSLKVMAQEVQLEIQDNGIGFNTDAIDDSKGLGWKNIFARIKLINGKLKVVSDKKNGTVYAMLIPASTE